MAELSETRGMGHKSGHKVPANESNFHYRVAICWMAKLWCCTTGRLFSLLQVSKFLLSWQFFTREDED